MHNLKKFLLISIAVFSTQTQFSKAQIQPVTGISTNFGGYWSTTTANNNPIRPNNSHELLSFTQNGVTYSTGVNNAELTSRGVNFTPGNFRAIPVAGILGSLGTNTTATLLAMASLKDGNPTQGVHTNPNIFGKTIRDVMIDGIRGLDIGTGVTNLPSTSVMNFGIHSINNAKISDAEPDILITQIAQPGSTNDITDTYSFRDAAGNIVGNSVSQAQSALTQLGTYSLDLFSLTQGPLTNATPYGHLFEAPNGFRPIRLAAYKLSDFGISDTNAFRIVSFRVNPSGSSDLAFVGYNANSINFRPAISPDPGNSLSNVCPGGTAILKIIASPANEGVLTYRWEQKIGAGAWTPISNGAPFSGATTDELRVSNPTAGHQYRCIVTESGSNGGVPFNFESIGEIFTIAINNSIGAPTIASQPVNASGCVGNPFSFFTVASGGSGVYTYQWYSGASLTGPYTLINGATESSFSGTITSAAFYRVIISNDGCNGSVTSNTVSVTTTGAGTVLSTNNGERCGPGTVNLSANSSNGGTFTWRNGNGDIVSTNANYAPSVTTTTNFFVTATLSGCTTSSNTVTATVNSAPVITTCPTNINLNNTSSQFTEMATYLAEASGSPAPTFTYVFSGATIGSGSGTGSGSVFNKGVTNVAITATNTCSTAICNFTVTNHFLLSGTIKNDVNGLTDNEINGVGSNAGATFISIVSGGAITNNANGTSTVTGGSIVTTVPINSDGTYIINSLNAGTYRAVLHNSISGSLTTALNAGWVNTGEGVGISSDGLANGIVSFDLTTSNLADINFGVQQRPTASGSAASTLPNPGGTTEEVVQSSIFSGSDPDGIIAEIRISTFPTNTTTIRINNVAYTSGSWPTDGVKIPTNSNGNPTQAITIDPIDGDVNVEFTFFTIDNANAESLNSSISSVPFVGVRTLTLIANPVCINDVPYMDYSISANFNTTGLLATITWTTGAAAPGISNPHNLSLVQNVVVADQPLAGLAIWPGASAAPANWPGWVEVNAGEWVFQEDGYSGYRTNPGFSVSVNPTVEVLGGTNYPTATPACSSNPSFEISGIVKNNVTGFDQNSIAGLPTNIQNQLYVSLVDPANNTIQSTVAVDANGEFLFGVVKSLNYAVVLHTSPAGSTSSALPTNWVSTSQGANTVYNTTGNGVCNFVVSGETFVEFGVQERPTAGDGMAPTPINFGENVPNIYFVSIPFNAFFGDDVDGGTLNAIVITKWPSNTDALQYNDTTYYENSSNVPTPIDCPTAVCTVFPTGGLVVSLNNAGNDWDFPLLLDATTGAIIIELDYKVIDNAGFESMNEAQAILQFNSAPLSVGCLGFEGENNQGVIDLSWSTSTETNNLGFRIERSNNGLDFKEIGFINGAGNSTNTTQYTFMDRNPIAGNNYYRLISIDNNQKESQECKVILVKVDAKSTAVQVYPNPSNGIIYLNKGLETVNQIDLMDANGKILITKIGDLNEINFQHLAAGIYYLRVRTENGVSTHKLMVNY